MLAGCGESARRWASGHTYPVRTRIWRPSGSAGSRSIFIPGRPDLRPHALGTCPAVRSRAWSLPGCGHSSRRDHDSPRSPRPAPPQPLCSTRPWPAGRPPWPAEVLMAQAAQPVKPDACRRVIVSLLYRKACAALVPHEPTTWPTSSFGNRSLFGTRPWSDGPSPRGANGSLRGDSDPSGTAAMSPRAGPLAGIVERTA